MASSSASERAARYSSRQKSEDPCTGRGKGGRAPRVSAVARGWRRHVSSGPVHHRTSGRLAREGDGCACVEAGADLSAFDRSRPRPRSLPFRIRSWPRSLGSLTRPRLEAQQSAVGRRRPKKPTSRKVVLALRCRLVHTDYGLVLGWQSHRKPKSNNTHENPSSKEKNQVK